MIFLQMYRHSGHERTLLHDEDSTALTEISGNGMLSRRTDDRDGSQADIADPKPMSALHPEADIASVQRHVR
jgi:hypothetical protein